MMKKTVRAELARALSLQSADEIAESSSRACSLLSSTPQWKNSKSVLLYRSMRTEVQTRSLIELALNEGKLVCLPHSPGSDKASRIDKLADLGLVDGRGLLHGGSAGLVDVKAIDLAVVPGMAFDLSGNRLGRGGGFYDRLLPQMRATKVGLAFAFQVTESLPAEDHDAPVDFIATEERVIDCRKSSRQAGNA